MSRDRLKQIALGLGVLIFLWGAVEIFRGDFDQPTGDFRIPAVIAETTDSIVLRRAADTMVLVNHAGRGWTVNCRESLWRFHIGVRLHHGISSTTESSPICTELPMSCGS